ncbi:unnamed protein product [Sphagnum troendelagicum]|uniref:Alcohol dehydrogenase-like N-terminal domain-containing protein n=1 Tax=Sphagnum troendelagicum TaxID=128251 RepID=A0ABP0ULS3_9BRYO
MPVHNQRWSGDNEVSMHMKAVGVCGSDVHYVKHLQCGDFIVKEPMVIGHECAGIVEESGKDVEHLVVGDCVLWSLGFLVTIVMNAKRVLTTYVPT